MLRYFSYNNNNINFLIVITKNNVLNNDWFSLKVCPVRDDKERSNINFIICIVGMYNKLLTNIHRLLIN